MSNLVLIIIADRRGIRSAKRAKTAATRTRGKSVALSKRTVLASIHAHPSGGSGRRSRGPQVLRGARGGEAGGGSARAARDGAGAASLPGGGLRGEPVRGVALPVGGGRRRLVLD